MNSFYHKLLAMTALHGVEETLNRLEVHMETISVMADSSMESTFYCKHIRTGAMLYFEHVKICYGINRTIHSRASL